MYRFADQEKESVIKLPENILITNNGAGWFDYLRWKKAGGITLPWKSELELLTFMKRKIIHDLKRERESRILSATLDNDYRRRNTNFGSVMSLLLKNSDGIITTEEKNELVELVGYHDFVDSTRRTFQQQKEWVLSEDRTIEELGDYDILVSPNWPEK